MIALTPEPWVDVEGWFCASGEPELHLLLLFRGTVLSAETLGLHHDVVCVKERK